MSINDYKIVPIKLAKQNESQAKVFELNCSFQANTPVFRSISNQRSYVLGP